MNTIFPRVAAWNAARYPQEFSLTHTNRLLTEELFEALEAEEKVNYIKELCDIIYVALGSLWKLNFPQKAHDHFIGEAAEHIARLPYDKIEPIEYISSHVNAIARENADVPVLLHGVVFLALAQLQGIGLTKELAVKCMHAVCDSNDSKSIVKPADIHTKANHKNKGPFYKPAEPMIAAILREAGIEA